MKTDRNEITALSLIEKVFKFISMTPSPQDWNIDALRDNKPRLIRLKEINILLKLYLPEIYKKDDVKGSIENMLNGEFIYARQVQNYSEVFLKMDYLIAGSMDRNQKAHQWELEELQCNYERLIDFKKMLFNLKEFNSGIVEISYPYFYSVLVSKNIFEKMDCDLLDDFLESVIAPEKKVYKKDKLILLHKYPYEDLDDIDMDWM